MSKRLRNLSGFEVVKMLCNSHGFVKKSRVGSHVTIEHESDSTRRTTVPQHKVIGIGLMKEILKQVKLNEYEFFNVKKKK